MRAQGIHARCILCRLTPPDSPPTPKKELYNCTVAQTQRVIRYYDEYPHP